MNTEPNLIETVGFADACELFGRAFAFPDEEFAEALANGTFLEDFRSCSFDIGMDISIDAEQACCMAALMGGRSTDKLLEELRKAYSVTYLLPGNPAIFPYEAPFRFVADGKGGVPPLFRASVTLDVECHMRTSGVIPEDSRRIPCDAIDKELIFLSFLLGSKADAMFKGDDAAVDAWDARVACFIDEHAAVWMPAFFEKTVECKDAGPYRDIARLALIFVRFFFLRRSDS